jgi:hypothetical protein
MILSALRCLVDNTMSPENNKSANQSIQWNRWVEILSKHKDNKEGLWAAMTGDDFHDELLSLIRQHQLQFFHPYLPLTDDQYNTLLLFAQKRATLNNHEEPVERTPYKNRM